MADVALSTSSPLASLLTTTAVDSAAAPGATTNTDPFAALFASVAGVQTPVAAQLKKMADLPSISVMAEPTLPQDPIISVAMPDSDDSDTSDGNADALADAIASGPMAVLAFAPTIAPPVGQALPVAQPMPVATPTPTPVRIDAPVASAMPRKLPTVGTTTPTTTAKDIAAISVPAASTAPAEVPVTRTAARDGDGDNNDNNQQQKRATPAPATAAVAISEHVMKAVIASLKGDAPVTPKAAATVSTTIVSPTPTPVAEAPVKDAPVATQVATAQQATPAPVLTPVRRANTDAAAPIRDTRKRGDAPAFEMPSVAVTQRAADTLRTAAHDAAATLVGSKGDAVVQQVLDIGRDDAWLDGLARDIAKSAGSGNDLHFKLNPQHLGALSVAIAQSEDGASIRMTADTETTRNMLQEAQPKLIAEARVQGLKVAETHVDLKDERQQQTSQDRPQDNQRGQNGAAGQNSTAQNGQNRQSSPAHQPFVSNLGRKADAETESPERDSDALYA